jgi:hypothetical protein
MRAAFDDINWLLNMFGVGYTSCEAILAVKALSGFAA